MKTIERALRAMSRNPLRSGLLAALLTVSVSLALVMITVSSAFGKRMDDVKNEVGSQVTVSTGGQGFLRGGGFGFQNSDTTTDSETETDAEGDAEVVLTTDDAAKLTELDHVTSMTGTLRAMSIDTTLVAVPFQAPEGIELPEGFEPPETTNDDGTIQISTVGVSDPDSIVSSGETATTELIDGRVFTTSELDAMVAVVSESLAAENDLAVGDTFEIAGQSLEVIGIVATSSGFGATQITLPLTTAQTVLGQPEELSQVVLQVDDIEHVEGVATLVESTLGDDFNVTTSVDQYNQIAGTLEDAQASSQLALIVAGISSALVIVFGIVLAARQRLKEIGILKAIGAANRQVIAQFGVETLVIGLMAGVLGAVITFPLAQTVADGLTSSGGGGGGALGGGQGQLPFGNRQGFGGGGLFGSVDVAVSPMIFVYALLFALGLAVVASIGPAWQVSRIRPAEVLRHD